MEDFFWHFGVREGGSDTADNIDAKFFIDKYASLVRESLQNSLDAQADADRPVHVSYKFGSVEIPSNSAFYELEMYIQGCLRMHPNPNDRVYKAYTPMLEYIQHAKAAGRISYLEVSDSNTIGMDYVDDDIEGATSRWYSFAKSVGNTSKKNDTSGGSYGLGKAVFYKNSSLRTIFISTKTEDNSVAFEGISSLCTSKIADKKYEATGYFCRNIDEKPTLVESDIPELFRRKECGTSIYIMGIDDSPEVQAECYNKIQKAIASHFWLSIMHKKLVVEIGENNVIDDTNIIEKTTECFDATDDESPKPFMETVYYAESGEFEDYVKHEQDVENLGKCVLYIHRDRRNGRDVVLNMRRTEMLIFEQSILKGYGFYGIFVCLGEEGNKILRMSEDPAHKSWNSNCCEGADVQKARAAIQSKNAFIKQTIIDHFGNANENTASISDLQNYLYFNVSEQELEAERQSLYGIHSMEEQGEESVSKIPTLFPEDQTGDQQPKPEDIPVFTVEDNETVSKAEDDDKDTMWGGHDGHGGESTEELIKPIPDEEYRRDDEGKEKGRLLLPTSMKACAVYTKKVDGILYHFLRVIPTKDCAELVLDVSAVGDAENASDEIYIDEVLPGNLEGHNRISGLSARGGERLEIGIKFEDNMSHPVNVLAYEVSQVQ